MNQQDDQARFRRILVALDASRHSLAALEAAVELAAKMQAELEGLFVEDVNLLRAAGSPVAREVLYPFTDAARLEPERMERGLRAQAEQGRQALAAASEQREIRWSFRVVRGEVAPEVVAAAQEADLLVLGKVSRPLIRQIRLGSTALAAAVQAPCCVLLLRRDTGIRPPIVVAYDGSPTARQALRIATQLARENGNYLAVLMVASTADEEYKLQAQTADWLRRQGLLIRYRRLAEAGVATLTQAMLSEGNGVLVLSSTILPPAELQELLDEVDFPVLLVR